jgi:DNA gyrase/topoisomerase IV subunit B
MAKKQEYSAEDIKILSDREHVRLRTQIYLGNTKKIAYAVPLFLKDKFEVREIEFIPAVYKAVGEIIDNSIDEFAQINIPNKLLSIEANPVLGTYTIMDNGRGVPIDMHSSGKYTPEVAFGSLRSGRNFTEGKETGVIGQNGVGSACTNYCSVEFAVDIHRDGKRYRQTFSDGAKEISKPSIRAGSDKTGTSVAFQLDSQVFDDPTLPDDLMHNRAIEIALTNPGVAVEYNDYKYKYKKGFEEIIKDLSKDYFKFEQGNIEFFVVFDINKAVDEQIFSWVNSSLLFDGGLCNTQFLNAFYDRVMTHLAKDAKKAKCEITKNDVRQGLLVLGNLKLQDPQYDAQSKTRLTGPNLRNELAKMIDDNWSSFFRKNKGWLTSVFERAMIRHHIDENKKAIKEHQKNLNKKVPSLVDATSKNRFETCLLITEGDSAASMITEARDPKTIASLPLSGKVNNVYGTTAAQLLNMGKITDMLTAIGLVPGQKAIRSTLNYGKVIIATDADFDGSDIFTLLTNLFYTFWPDLFSKDYDPFFYRMVAPNVVASKGGKRVHFTTRSDFEKAKERYKGFTIEYMKGLGSMHKDDWKLVIAGLQQYSIPIIDDGNITATLELLFGNDAEARKNWLQAPGG